MPDSKPTDDLVDRLWASDAASVLTNQAARRIDRLNAERLAIVIRLEEILRKIVEHADEGTQGSPPYAYDRLKQIQMLAVYAVERIIREDCNNV